MELAKQVCESWKLHIIVIKLNKNLYVLRGVANIWHDLVATQYRKVSLAELRTAPCDYKKEWEVVICCMDALLMFSNAEKHCRVKKACRTSSE